MTRRVAPFDGAPSAAMWRVERRAAYRRARGLGVALLLLIAVLFGVLLVGVATAAAAEPATTGATPDYTVVNVGIGVVALVLVAYIGVTEWAKRREGRDR